MTEPVLALDPAPLSLRRARLDEGVLNSLWFVPLCSAVLAWIAARGALAVDLAVDRQPGSGLTADRSAFGVVAATIAAAMLTFLGVVFSTTLVAVQLAASQYSPRIVRLFVRSRLTQVTLGIFLATFVYSITALVGIEGADDEVVPAVTLVSMFLLVLVTVATFIAFIHGIVQLLRVQYLLRLTARSSHDAIDVAFPTADRYRSVPGPEPDPAARPVRRGGSGPKAPRVLQAVDHAGLAARAAAADCWVELLVLPGHHVGPSAVVARVHGPGRDRLTDEIVLAHLLFGTERTLLQDPAFGIRQLVDAASRALSPAINDPTTAVQALHRIVDLLERIARRPDPTGWYLAGDGSVRVQARVVPFGDLLALGFAEIVRYGADAPQVTRTVLALCDELESAVSADRAPLVAAERDRCLAALADAVPASFRDLASEPDRGGLG